ncbi:MAG: hypothetical protein U1A73_04535 [Pseudomonas sp.]|nr:hypothetical protein [Pseudomonas sp.]
MAEFPLRDQRTQLVVKSVSTACEVFTKADRKIVDYVQFPRELAPLVAGALVPETVAAVNDLVLELAAMLRVWDEPMAQVMGWTNVGVLRQKLAAAQARLAQLEPPAEGGG